MSQRGWCSSTRHTTSEIVTAIAVKEWLENPADYQGFLTIDDESNGEVPLVIHEAPKFLQPGYFHGPLANTMVTAISNVPIIIFSSALHHPIIYISPRRCTVSAPLYAAFNQHGERHYNAITFQEHSTSSTTASQCCDASFQPHSRCGVNDKKGKEHCTKMRKYHMHTMSMSTSQSTLYRLLPV